MYGSRTAKIYVDGLIQARIGNGHSIGVFGASENSGGRPRTCEMPWHGYDLGDWTDRWETFARRAASGDWERSGRDTLARQRGGLLPETPARFDKEPK
jgi:hypothetical protein